MGSDTDKASYFEPVSSTRTFERAIDHLVDGIERARLRTGDRLPNEGDLCDQLQISKPTLRQALRVLERAGLLRVRRGSGGGVFLASDLVPTDLISGFVALEEHAVVDVLVGRRIVETGATNLALVSASDDDFAEIARTIDLLRRNLGDRPQVMRADAAFHRAVSYACHNKPLQASMRIVARDLAPIRDAYHGGEEDAVTLDVHTRQLDVMQRRAAGDLVPVLDEHFRMLETDFAESIGKSWEELFGRAVAGIPAAIASEGAGT